jgi:hypothetical protein
MNEAEWLACTEPEPMLKFLLRKTSDRKWRLYLCGGCRHITKLFFDPNSLVAVKVAERFADGEATAEELERAEYFAESPTFGYELEEEGFVNSSPVKMRVAPRLVEMGALPEFALSGGRWLVDEVVKQRLIAAASLAERCAFRRPRKGTRWLLRCISQVEWPGRWLCDCVFGNPFRPVALDAAWLAWNAGTVQKMAQAIYDDRAFDQLPILADALEEAGCTVRDILDHCRSGGDHVRGCWVIDLLLGKE